MKNTSTIFVLICCLSISCNDSILESEESGVVVRTDRTEYYFSEENFKDTIKIHAINKTGKNLAWLNPNEQVQVKTEKGWLPIGYVDIVRKPIKPFESVNAWITLNRCDGNNWVCEYMKERVYRFQAEALFGGELELSYYYSNEFYMRIKKQ